MTTLAWQRAAPLYLDNGKLQPPGAVKIRWGSSTCLFGGRPEEHRHPDRRQRCGRLQGRQRYLRTYSRATRVAAPPAPTEVWCAAVCARRGPVGARLAREWAGKPCSTSGTWHRDQVVICFASSSSSTRTWARSTRCTTARASLRVVPCR
ncbi:hypothetical protein PF66_04663 [Pseudomonas asplenii]|uniref:Uncharacterized protein n=1 Tax=Pseudomonas asplenii TaxID=53407 RepID=A0A0N0E2K2_9PSED|nr:hypothetical protein PF66_04663 [Pseudomonas fuscovaginae]